MIVSRITINLKPEERNALEALCKMDIRPPKMMIRHLIMNEAKRRGLLTDPPKDESEETRG